MKALSERTIDEIVIVSDDIHKTLNTLSDTFGHDRWSLINLRGTGGEIERVEAVNIMQGRKALRVVEPRSDSVFKRFLCSAGAGIFGIVERIPDTDAPKMRHHLESRGITVCDGDNGLFWADFNEYFGGYYGFRRASVPAYPENGQGSLRQVCLVTPDVEKTAEQLSEYLLMGPTEIGHSSSKTVTNPVSSEYPEGLPEFEFLAGMLFFGNMELEVVQPCHGPLAYFDFLKRRGQGFHHIKTEVPDGQWDSTLQRFYSLGIREGLSGKIGTCGFSNLLTEDMLGFVYELSDGAPMLALPDGYNPYFHP